jgi:hypothetical protein
MKGTRKLPEKLPGNHPRANPVMGSSMYRDPAKARATADSIMARIQLMDTPEHIFAGRNMRRLRAYRAVLSLAAALVIALVSSLVTRGALGNNDTVAVRFVLVAPEARTVTLVADFNEWSTEGHMLTRNDESGEWEILVPLRKGRSYVYNFLIDDEYWLPDPAAAGQIDDGLGGVASYISL